MLLIDWNIQDSPVLKALTFKDITLSHSYRDKKLQNMYKNKRFWPQEVYNNQPHSSPFSMKETWILTWVRWFSGPLTSQISGFPNQVLSFPNSLYYWPIVQQAVWDCTWWVWDSHTCTVWNSLKNKNKKLSVTPALKAELFSIPMFPFSNCFIFSPFPFFFIGKKNQTIGNTYKSFYR